MRPSSTLVLGRELPTGGGPYSGKTLPATQTDNTNLDVADGTNTIIIDNPNHKGVYSIHNTIPQPAHIQLDNMPSDFISMDSFSVNIKYRKGPAGGNNDDLWTIACRVTLGSNWTPTTATDIIAHSSTTLDQSFPDDTQTASWHLVDGDSPDSWTTSGAVAFSSVQAADKTDWDGAHIWLGQMRNQVMGGDGDQIEVDWVEFTGTYTGSSPP